MQSNPPRGPNEAVLVAILKNPRDFAIARDEHWYRIPVSSARKWLDRRWPPQWLAFYRGLAEEHIVPRDNPHEVSSRAQQKG